MQIPWSSFCPQNGLWHIYPCKCPSWHSNAMTPPTIRLMNRIFPFALLHISFTPANDKWSYTSTTPILMILPVQSIKCMHICISVAQDATLSCCSASISHSHIAMLCKVAVSPIIDNSSRHIISSDWTDVNGLYFFQFLDDIGSIFPQENIQTSDI